MALTVTLVQDGFWQESHQNVQLVDVAFDSSYLDGGESLTPAMMGFATINHVEVGPVNGYRFEYNIANELLKAYWDNQEVTQTINIGDDDTAATNGVLVYVHGDELLEDGTQLGHLEFVSPTNAIGVTAINTGTSVPNLIIRDDDTAATGGTLIYLDENGTAGQRILTVATNNRDLYVPLSDGSFLRITDDDTAATNGVQIYFDENGTDGSARLLFVSPTNANGTDVTDNRQGWRSGEVANAFDLSGLTGVRLKVTGT